MLTRGRALTWAHRLRSVVEHQRNLVAAARTLPRRGRPNMRRGIENDLAILDAILEELAELGEAPGPKTWRDRIGGFADRQRAMLLGLLIYDVVGDLAGLEEVAIAIENVARGLATTAEIPIADPNAETTPGITPPILPPRSDDDRD